MRSWRGKVSHRTRCEDKLAFYEFFGLFFFDVVFLNVFFRIFWPVKQILICFQQEYPLFCYYIDNLLHLTGASVFNFHDVNEVNLRLTSDVMNIE